MFFRMLKQSFFEGRRNKIFAIVTVCLSSGLISAMMNLSIEVGDKMTRELKSYGANINLLSKSENLFLKIGGVDYNPLKGRTFLDEKDLPKIKNIFWRHNIVGFAPFLKGDVEVEGKGESPVQLVGTYFDKSLPIPDEKDFHTGVRVINPYWQVRGEWPQDDDSACALAGAILGKKMGWKIGDKIRVRTAGKNQAAETLTIKGFLHTGGAEENGIIVPLKAAQRILGLSDKVQSVSVSALAAPEDKLCRKARRDMDSLTTEEYDQWYCTAYVGSIAFQIEEVISNAKAQPIWKVAASEGTIINKIQLLMFVVTGAAFLASVLGISSLMSSAIMERSREIGLMKALGAADWEVHLLFMVEAAILGVIGGMLGWIAGCGLSQVMGWNIFKSAVSFHPVTIPVIILISVLIAIGGSLVPSRIITRLRPAGVLHGC